MMQTIETTTAVDVGLFDGVDAATLTEVISVARTRFVGAGDTLCEQGDDADSFFTLKTGAVKLTQSTPDGDVAVLRLLGPGDVLGGAAAMGAGTHPVTAVAVTETIAYEWPGAVMTSLMERHGRLAVNALRLIASRLYDLQEERRLLAAQKVERRIARAVARLLRHWGTRTDEGVVIGLPVSREDLAQMAGTTQPAVSRALSRWESAGIIDASHARLLVRTPHALASIADEFD